MAFRDGPGQPWAFCTKKQAEAYQELGFQVTTSERAWRENRQLALDDLWASMQGFLNTHPGRTPAKLRPDGKPEPNFKAPRL